MYSVWGGEQKREIERGRAKSKNIERGSTKQRERGRERGTGRGGKRESMHSV